MTVDEWNALKAGDVVLDRHFTHREDGGRRTIIEVGRHRSRNSSTTRTALVVSSFKSYGRRTIIFETENTGPSRFDLAPTEDPR